MEDRILLTRAVLLTTYAWRTIQFTKNLYLVIMFLEFMELNMKHSLAYIPVVSSNTMYHVLYVTWQHVLHKWWYQVVMCVPRDGYASTRGTWCRSKPSTGVTGRRVYSRAGAQWGDLAINEDIFWQRYNANTATSWFTCLFFAICVEWFDCRIDICDTFRTVLLRIDAFLHQTGINN